jgi:YegS/Rv2252/BmrU family lipid kinase
VEQKTRLLIWANPLSGGKNKKKLPLLLDRWLNKDQFEYELIFWNHANEKLSDYSDSIQKADVLVAAGGDGTVNHVAAVCMAFEKALGFLPFGSGNGLARHLKIPLWPENAIRKLNQGKFSAMDIIYLNDQLCLNIAGAGFDAAVAHSFAAGIRRGFIGYATQIFKNLFTYKEYTLKVTIDDRTEDHKAFMLGVANGSQWGYGYSINPKGSLSDGLMEVYMVKKPSIFSLPALFLKARFGNLDTSSVVRILQAHHVELSGPSPLQMHIDGEPVVFESPVVINIKPGALRVFY